MICRDTPTHGWVCGWMGVSVGQWVGLGHITKYQINLDLIMIIQFCLNMYDLLDILDIFLDILLKLPQPLMGLFLKHEVLAAFFRSSEHTLTHSLQIDGSFGFGLLGYQIAVLRT